MLFRENHPYRLRRIDLENFKSVLDESVELGPLTVVVGANSSGKSTLLQAVLAVAQAVRSETYPAGFPLNGEYVNLGTYRDVRSFRTGTQGPPIKIGLQVKEDCLASYSSGFSSSLADEKAVRCQLEAKRELWPVPEFKSDMSSWDNPKSHLTDWLLCLVESNDSGSGNANIDQLKLTASLFFGDEDQKLVVGLDSGRLQEHEGSVPLGRTRRSRGTHRELLEVQSGGVGRIEVSAFKGVTVKEMTGEFDAIALDGRFPGNVFARHRSLEQYAHAWWSDWHEVAREGELVVKEGDGLDELRSKGHMYTAHRAEPHEHTIAPGERARAERAAVEQAAQDVRAAHRIAREGRRLVEPAPDFVRLRRALDDERRYLVVQGILSLEESGFIAQLQEEMKDETWLDEDVVVSARWVSEAHMFSRHTIRDLFGADEFSQFRYLGPIRQEPLVLHERGTEAADIGKRGEYAAAVLHEYANRTVTVPLPDGQVREIQLGAALNEWLEWFGLADGAAAEDHGRQGIGLKVRPEGAVRDVDLTAVGVGVSQALPVILVCLLTQDEELLILEQPELHLHPALQQRVADFLLLFVRSGRQILVETHSEHLVNRLRTQVAADDTNQIGELIKLLFAEQSEGITSYRESKINEYGGVSEDWPDGFLDLSAKSAQDLVRQSLRKRQQHKSSS